MDEYHESRVIAKLKNGDIHALTPLVQAYQHRALRTAYLITQDQALAQDVTQSAFVHAFECIHQFEASRRFLPWFLKIIVNMAVQISRQQARTFSLDSIPDHDEEMTWADLQADSMLGPEAQLEMKELEHQMEALLQRLSTEQRAVIVLRYYVDFTESQMADALNVPQGTIKSRLFNARKQLRRLLGTTP